MRSSARREAMASGTASKSAIAARHSAWRVLGPGGDGERDREPMEADGVDGVQSAERLLGNVREVRPRRGVTVVHVPLFFVL